jgi:hypothetical protein
VKGSIPMLLGLMPRIAQQSRRTLRRDFICDEEKISGTGVPRSQR